MADPEINVVALTKTYFEVWNSPTRRPCGACTRTRAVARLGRDARSHNAAVAAGVAGIWKAEPTIKCEIIDLYTCGPDLTVVANINVVVNAEVTIKSATSSNLRFRRVTSLNGLKKD